MNREIVDNLVKNTETTIEKPNWYNLKQWRDKNGYITPEWNMYIDANEIKTFFIAMMGVLVGFVAGIFFVR